MKKITLFILKTCPYCKQAIRFMNELFAENPEYQSLEIEVVDESKHRDFAAKYDYYLVPTYYVGSIKMHEGVPSLYIVRQVFDEALRDD